MSKSTPGPWAYDGGINRVYSTATNQCVAAIHIAGNPACEDAWPADARLIAAAPELLEALKGISADAETQISDYAADIQEGGKPDSAEIRRWEAVLKAIAKAEGRE